MSSPSTQRFQNSNAIEIYPAKEIANPQPIAKIYMTTAPSLNNFFHKNTSNLTRAPHHKTEAYTH